MRPIPSQIQNYLLQETFKTFIFSTILNGKRKFPTEQNNRVFLHFIVCFIKVIS